MCEAHAIGAGITINMCPAVGMHRHLSLSSSQVCCDSDILQWQSLKKICDHCGELETQEKPWLSIHTSSPEHHPHNIESCTQNRRLPAVHVQNSITDSFLRDLKPGNSAVLRWMFVDTSNMQPDSFRKLASHFQFDVMLRKNLEGLVMGTKPRVVGHASLKSGGISRHVVL